MEEIYFRNNSGKFNLLRKYQFNPYSSWKETNLEKETYHFSSGKVTFYHDGTSCFMETTNFGPFPLYVSTYSKVTPSSLIVSSNPILASEVICFRDNSGSYLPLRKYQFNPYSLWKETNLEKKTYDFSSGKVTFYHDGTSCFMETTNFGPFPLYVNTYSKVTPSSLRVSSSSI